MILQSVNKNKEIKKGLYIVSTPIGNLGDITLRAIDILMSSEYILCEDTRVTKKLLDKYKIETKLISNHKFNESKNLSKIISILKSGNIISSDIDKQILGLLIDKIFGFLFGFIFSYIIFSTIIYFTNNFELLNFLNEWLLDNSYLLSELDSFNDSLLNSIIGVEDENIS